MKARRFFPIWLVISLPGYIGWRLLPALTSGAGLAFAMLLLFAACVLVPVSVRTRTMENRAIANPIAWVGLITMGFLSSLFVMTLLRDVFLLGAHLVLPRQQAALLSAPSARWTLALTLASTVVGFLIARRPRLVDVEVPIARLPRALHGFTIVQISDLHVGPTIKRGFVARIVVRVNELKADLIAITGDLVDGTVRELTTHTAPLADLAARHGVFFVTGNHEYYSGERDWTAELRRLGLTVLKNQHVILQHDGASLLLAGITDFSAHHFDPAQKSDPVAALRGAPVDALPRILLAHQPSSAAGAADAGFDLQISGHTHGGQFWPWNFFVRYFQPFTSGLNRLRSLWVYVSSGTGYWGPPNRFIVPAELTRIRLVLA